MVAVSPMPSDIENAQRPARPLVRILRPVGRCIKRVGGRLPGEYTVAKLDAFNHFRRQTTPWQMTGILLLTPLGCLVANALVESIPLADPATGFYHSTNFQGRNLIVATTVMVTLVTTKVSCLDKISSRSWLFIGSTSVAIAAVAIFTNAAVAVLADVFPVPFTQFIPSGPMVLIGFAINYFFLETAENRARLQKLDRWLAMDLLPILVYPIFTALFMALKSSQQLWLSLLLPVLKHWLRYLLWLVVKDEIDLVGAATCSVGHLYHVLFTVMCLQNAKSLETYAVVVALNVSQMLLNCHGILRDARELQTAAQRLAEISEIPSGDVLSAALAIAQQEHVLRSLNRKMPSRLFSSFPGYQRHEFMAKCQAHQVSPSRQVERKSSRRQSLPTQRKLSHDPRVSSIQDLSCILPWADDSTKTDRVASGVVRGAPAPENVRSNARRRSSQAYESQATSARHQEAYVRHCTAVLHQTEIVLLRSYITVWVMPFYGVYQALIFWLPNRKYFATMETTTTFDEVASMNNHMLLLASLELLFLAMYTVLISRQLGFSAIHQLTFVLWSQRILIQGKFIMLPIMILGFPLEHFGNGIIFQLRTEV